MVLLMMSVFSHMSEAWAKMICLCSICSFILQQASVALSPGYLKSVLTIIAGKQGKEM